MNDPRGDIKPQRRSRAGPVPFGDGSEARGKQKPCNQEMNKKDACAYSPREAFLHLRDIRPPQSVFEGKQNLYNPSNDEADASVDGVHRSQLAPALNFSASREYYPRKKSPPIGETETPGGSNHRALSLQRNQQEISSAR